MQIYPWQQDVWKNLINQYHTNRLPRALLLNGREGIGKFDLARIFANVLLCASPQKEACFTCHSCRLFNSCNHPDFYVLTPESGMIKIDQIRLLIAQLSQTPRIAHRQVVLIRSAEKMNNAAANALLKTLEEPSGEIVFLLTSARRHQLPATILSRCQHQPCTMDQSDIGFKWLLKHISNEATAKLLWCMSDASPLLALNLFEQKYLQVRDVILKGMQNISQANKLPIDISKATSTLDLRYILQNWTTLVVDLWQLKRQVNVNYLTNQDQIDALKQLTKVLGMTVIERFYAVLLEAMAAEQANINLNKTLVLDSLWIQFSQCVAIDTGE